jgi:ferredoxin
MDTIGFGNVRRWLPARFRHLNIGEITNIITRNYCKRLQFQNACPIKTVGCIACKANIEEIFDFDKADNSYALITWRTRDAAARAIDAEQAKRLALPVSEGNGQTINFEDYL